MRKAPVLLAVIVAALFAFVTGPASAQITVTFFSGGNASAGWVTITPAPPGDPDDQSIALEVNAVDNADFDDFAGADLVGESTTLPVIPPSYDFQSSVTNPGSGGSPRLVLLFGNGGNAVLRPLSWTAGVWVTIDGAGPNWDVTGGPCPFQFNATYGQVAACEAGSGVTDVFVVSDSGWFHPGGYIHYIDNIQYDGEVITAPAPPPPACSDGIDNDGDGLVDFDGGPDGGEPDPGCTGPDDEHEEDGAPPPACSDGIDNDGDGLIDFDGGPDGGEPDPGCEGPDDETEENEPTCGDPDGDGDNHSNFAPEENEDGTVSGLIHDIDQGIVIPLVTADGGVVPEVNCAIVKGLLGA